MGITGNKKTKNDAYHLTNGGIPFSRPLFTSLPSDVQRGLLIGPMQARKVSTDVMYN
ncbi:hypothetical protein HMI55_005044 [Coelomomyces lativittatus]|nr:hypothetical protein HMI55_005044 [Coelomomyces lativittatus]